MKKTTLLKKLAQAELPALYTDNNIPLVIDAVRKDWALNRLKRLIGFFRNGTEVTISELFGPAWHLLSRSLRSQVSKAFKTCVKKKEIPNIAILTDENSKEILRNKSTLYLISGHKDYPEKVGLAAIYTDMIIPDESEDYLKEWALERMVKLARFFKPGTEVASAELFGPVWYKLPKSVRLSMPRSFKVGVTEKEIRGIFYLTDGNKKPLRRKGGIIYKVAGGYHGRR